MVWDMLDGCKTPCESKEHVLRPSDFSKHRKLTFSTPNFNSEYDNWSSKPTFAPRSPSGHLWILDYCFRILDSYFQILDLGFWNCEL